MTTNPFPFLALPLEIRLQIYHSYFTTASTVQITLDIFSGTHSGFRRTGHEILHVSRTIRREAKTVYSFDLDVRKPHEDDFDRHQFPPLPEAEPLFRPRGTLPFKIRETPRYGFIFDPLGASQIAVPMAARKVPGSLGMEVEVYFLVLDDRDVMGLKLVVVVLCGGRRGLMKWIAPPYGDADGAYVDDEGLIRQIDRVLFATKKVDLPKKWDVRVKSGYWCCFRGGLSSTWAESSPLSSSVGGRGQQALGGKEEEQRTDEEPKKVSRWTVIDKCPTGNKFIGKY